MHYVKYLWYVIKHKWFVMLECFRVGLFWRGIAHDMSKLSPSEFFPYARHFYGKKDKMSGVTYYRAGASGNEEFDFAWHLHQKRNDHHWQWWALPMDKDSGNPLRSAEVVHVFPMSKQALVEMICDWKGAGRAKGSTLTVNEWYKENGWKMRLHPDTRGALEKRLREEA